MELAAITTGAIMLTRRVFGKPPVDYCAVYRAASCTGRWRRHLVNSKEQRDVMGNETSLLLSPGGQRILVIIAHPGYAAVISGGTIARLVGEGREGHYTLGTSGNRG